jgi:mannose-6-phosphate isomerase-like protein (cupin superfamily)
MAIIFSDNVQPISRGGGITTIPLVTPKLDADVQIVTGISTYPKGMGAPLHRHNCDEQVTILEGIGEVEIDGLRTPLKQYDTTYVPAGTEHAFYNRGEAPLRILWIYPGNKVTRTFSATGETVEHLSAADLMSSGDD